MSGHMLDRPVWAALTTRQAGIAEREGGTLRMKRAIGAFAAMPDRSERSLAELGRLVGPDEQVVLMEHEPVDPPAGCEIVSVDATDQMILVDLPDAVPLPAGMVTLGPADAEEMLALATLTAPGPYRPEAWRFGTFTGVREEGRLIAMVGERMRPTGFTEISAICTHPDARGRGLARALSIAGTRAVAARGETPFLHVYAHRAGAIALYRKLGFAHRTTFAATTVKPSPNHN